MAFQSDSNVYGFSSHQSNPNYTITQTNTFQPAAPTPAPTTVLKIPKTEHPSRVAGHEWIVLPVTEPGKIQLPSVGNEWKRILLVSPTEIQSTMSFLSVTPRLAPKEKNYTSLLHVTSMPDPKEQPDSPFYFPSLLGIGNEYKWYNIGITSDLPITEGDEEMARLVYPGWTPFATWALEFLIPLPPGTLVFAAVSSRRASAKPNTSIFLSDVVNENECNPIFCQSSPNQINTTAPAPDQPNANVNGIDFTMRQSFFAVTNNPRCLTCLEYLRKSKGNKDLLPPLYVKPVGVSTRDFVASTVKELIQAVQQVRTKKPTKVDNIMSSCIWGSSPL